MMKQARLLVIVLYIVLAALGSVAAQDEDSDPLLDDTGTPGQDENADPQPDDTGTPGLVNAANNLNLPVVVPPPSDPWIAVGDGAGLQQAIFVGPPILPDMETVPITNPNVTLFADLTPPITKASTVLNVLLNRAYLPGNMFTVYTHNDDQDGKLLSLTDNNGGDYRVQVMDMMTETRLVRSVDLAKLLRRQSLDVVYSYTNPTNGITIDVFSDSTFVLENKDGLPVITGYFGIIGTDTVVALGEDLSGTRYAFYGDYSIAYTADGDVQIGNLFTSYTYEYDEDGKLLSLTDSDDGKYQVLVEDSGMVSITGPDGYKVLADETGTFELYDDAGDLVIEGNLYDTNYDEFVEFEASSADSESDAPVIRWFYDADGNYVEVLSDGTVVVTDPDGNVAFYSEDELVDENGNPLYSEEELAPPDNTGSGDDSGSGDTGFGDAGSGDDGGGGDDGGDIGSGDDGGGGDYGGDDGY